MKNLFKMSLLLLTATTIGCASTAGMSSTAGGRASPAELQLRQSMRKLWSDHVFWTRQYIVAAVQDDPSAQAASVRLLRNQEELGSAIAPFYGSAAGSRLTDLLKQHILIAVDLVTAAKAGDNAKQTDADRRWHQNAADIATFLSGANPNWPRQTLLDMLNEHLAVTTQEAVNRLQKKWNDDVVTFDRIYSQSLMMADALSDGIVKQFPARF